MSYEDDIGSGDGRDQFGGITIESINEFLGSEVTPLTDLRDRRRALVTAQENADAVKATICTKINNATPKELHERIMDLRDTDRQLYDYIWHLRSVKYGIWCTQCEQVKKVGGRDPEDVKHDVETEARGGKPDLHAIKKHIPLSATNKLAPLLTSYEQQKIIQQHGAVTTGPARIAERAGRTMTQAQLDAMPYALRQSLMSDPNFQICEAPAAARESRLAAATSSYPEPMQVPAAVPLTIPQEPAKVTLPPEILSGMDARVTALIKLREQIGDQMKQVDTFIGSLQQYATSTAAKSTAAKSTAAKSTAAKSSPSTPADAPAKKNEPLNYDFGDGSIITDDCPDIDAVITHACSANLAESFDL